MSLREQLHAYIAQLEKRLRWGTILRGLAILTGCALLATIVLVLIANAFAFSQGSVTAARFTLILILAVAAGTGLALPLKRLTRRHAVGATETTFPQFEQRLTTFVERDGRDPFVELLAGDTLQVAQFARPEELISDTRLWVATGASVVAFAALLWMVAAGPGFWGYGASVLWTGSHQPPIYTLRVMPGDAVVRRHADQMVSAIPAGLESPKVELYARFANSSKWEEIAMQPQTAGSFAGGYQFLFAGLPENVEYYVTAGAMTSKHYQIRVTDLPAVTQIRVTYHYPAWTGMPADIEERGGDLRAVVGTTAELEVSIDRPLEGAVLQLDSGEKIPLAGGQNNVDHGVYRGTIKMDHDGAYHVAGVSGGQTVRVSEDFFIEARKANPPQISLVRPHGDYQASIIEEVALAAKATDDYGLKSVELHYSVNGGPETTLDLLRRKGEKHADGSATLSLEAFNLVPGDLISVYATAKDANAESHTDMLFIQADPFEREFSQSQVGGGGGGGGQADPSEQISQREKEIIASTFKQQGDKRSTAQQAADLAKLLSESQATLRDQAVTLSGRLEARELTNEVQAISDFQKDMLAASGAMTPAAQQLQQQKWKDAIPNEQKALQFLLRAEATFRQIQVAFGRGGGGGGGGGAARDLAALFDLELDTQKNQYETGQNQQSSAEQRAQQIDDALKKLDELARRQQDLAQQQRNGTQSAEEKWQQQMLQREAEELQRQMEQQVAQNGQQSGSSSNSSSGSSSSSANSGSQSSRQGNANGADSRQQAAQQALDRLRQANDDMRRAASQNSSAADSRRAADRLREASDLLGGLEQQDASARLGSMAQTAGQIATRQKQQADVVRNLIAEQSAAQASGKTAHNPSAQEIETLIDDRQKATDDLSHLTQQMRSTARELASTQPGASNKLRGALSAMDENDLGSRMQHSSDLLRTGKFSDPAESAITNDLENLQQKIGEAARALGNAQPGSKDAELNRAMDNLSRLRDQLAGLGGRPNPQAGQQGQGGQQGGRGARSGQGQQGGQMGDRMAGPVGNAGGNRQGPIYGDLDTGNTRISGRAAAPDQGPVPGDTQRVIDQGVNLLNQLRSAVQDSPDAQKELDSLINQMRNLDPKRFPGNPALVEQMHQQLVSGVDELELRLRRELDQDRGSTIRNTDPSKIPAGYQNSVADYYRKLSGKQ